VVTVPGSIIVENIVQHRASKAVDAAVLFVDMSASAWLKVSDETWIWQRNIYTLHRRATKIVRANNGKVSKTIGDCVMAYFLGPRRDADAVLCAAQLLDSFQHLYEHFYGIDSTLWQFKVTAGVTSGQVYFLYPRDPYGPPVDLASRLQSVAEPGSAAIAAWTYQRAFQIDRELRITEGIAREDTVSVKGFGEVKIVRMR